ncbi:MAG: type I phosphomannose isomerase catalytic subunit [Bryobacteraceae bacterium]
MSSAPDKPIQLMPMFRERIWGRENLAPFFPVTPRGEHIGEVWFTVEENLTSLNRTLGQLIKDHPEILGSGANPQHPGICPLLVKLIFTKSRLSVQVHPDDDYAQKHHQSLGKTEAWYIVEANPLGKIALGFRESLSREKLREAAHSGEIEKLLNWRNVTQGEIVYVPAGTVHAIGEGLTLCEVQENSDLTYRLYDFGRGRELHLDYALNVAHMRPHNQEAKPVPLADWRDDLVSCPHFRMERLKPKPSIRIERGLPYYLLLLCVKGAGTIAQEEFTAGQAWLLPAGGEKISLDGPGSEWILAYTAERAAAGLHGE